MISGGPTPDTQQAVRPEQICYPDHGPLHAANNYI